MDHHTRQELHDLLSALLDGTLAPGQQERLGDLLRQHPEARDLYLAYFALHAELTFRGNAGALSRPVLPDPEKRSPAIASASRPRRRVRAVLGLAALAAGLLLVLAWWLRPLATSPDQSAEPTHQTVAVLLRASGAEWEETDLPTRVGAALPAGRLRLKSGFAQIEFYSGATVILAGPADFDLISSREAFCARGKLRATVPPQAQGFTIRSPGLDLIDRGTEFGLQVGDNHRTEVHVFQGKVELHDPASGQGAFASQELTTGQSVRVDGSGTVQPIELNPAGFLTAQDLAARSQAETRLRQQTWLLSSQALRRDPGLVVYYTFEPEQPWDRVLRDQAPGQPPHDGAIVGCSWVAGRWPGKQGLEFKRFSDRVRFHVSGEFTSLTLLAWVRVDALVNRHNSLMMTDAWDEGEPHWHIGAHGSVRLGIQGLSQRNGTSYVTPRVFTPDRLGEWVHLAVVYDGTNQQVRHHVNGESISQEPLRFRIPLRIGDAELGNWNVNSRQDSQPIRNFSGCMDEFMLFSRALSAEEVQRLYTEGRPRGVVRQKDEG